MGLNPEEALRMNPIEFYQMVNFYIKREKAKYGK